MQQRRVTRCTTVHIQTICSGIRWWRPDGKYAPRESATPARPYRRHTMPLLSSAHGKHFGRFRPRPSARTNICHPLVLWRKTDGCPNGREKKQTMMRRSKSVRTAASSSWHKKKKASALYSVFLQLQYSSAPVIAPGAVNISTCVKWSIEL